MLADNHPFYSRESSKASLDSWGYTQKGASFTALSSGRL